MSPKPTVVNTVTVKYNPATRVTGSLNESGCISDMVT